MTDSAVLVHNACGKTLWDITKNAKGTLKFKFTGKNMVAYMDKSGYYWVKDLAGHGGSAYKVYVKVGKTLQWVADADKYRNFIIGKAKSLIGMVIKL